jgi:hypothetical protein
VTTANWLASALLLISPLACGNDRNDANSTAGSIPPPLDGGETGDDDVEPEDGGEFFDVAPGAEGGGDESGEQDGCQKVDLLFVIDDSDSMQEDQASLVSSFPGFVSGIETLVDVADYHVGVITSDEYTSNPPGCDVYGGLVTATHGYHSSESVCGPFANGKNFMTAADQLDVDFGCTAMVGASGHSDEHPMEAMTTAVSPALVNGCNEGFFRDDAVLVIVMITDEEDDYYVDLWGTEIGSPGDPGTWFDAISASKQGNEESIVVLSLVNPIENECVQDGNAWEYTARLVEFTEMFTYGFVGDICAPNYDEYFVEALAVIDEACDEFVPPG